MERPSAQKVIHAETFNEVCEVLNKVHNTQRTEWDLHVPVILWAYRTTCKKLMAQEPPRLEYGANVVIRIEHKMPSPCIVAPTDMTVHETLKEWIV